ncbi:hypothetical protein [Microbaculum marinum]|uniref:Uncharacterized protein n=1 Tax=Microbaculum marinum TaxID=1764581 RepID=A0AAW9RYJ9_9HYPH
MYRKHVVTGVIAGAMMLTHGTAAVSQTAGATLLMAQQDGVGTGAPDPRLEVPEVPGVPSITDPPETRIPEQMYPCNPGAFEPSDEVGEPETPAIVDDCEDVIAPPPSGDGEIDVEPPEPNAGSMPVIKPQELQTN